MEPMSKSEFLSKQEITCISQGPVRGQKSICSLSKENLIQPGMEELKKARGGPKGGAEASRGSSWEGSGLPGAQREGVQWWKPGGLERAARTCHREDEAASGACYPPAAGEAPVAGLLRCATPWRCAGLAPLAGEAWSWSPAQPREAVLLGAAAARGGWWGNTERWDETSGTKRCNTRICTFRGEPRTCLDFEKGIIPKL